MSPPFLDLTLGSSLRVAIVQLNQFTQHDTLRIFPKPCGAPRQMSSDDVVSVFEAIGGLSNLRRLELRCRRASPGTKLELPAQALTPLLLKAQNLKDLLMTGVRISGSFQDMQVLANAMLCHPSIQRLFVNDCHPSTKRESASLIPLLEAAAANSSINALAVSNVKWVGMCLGSIVILSTRLRSLRLNGIICADLVQWQLFCCAIQSSRHLKQLRITSCSLPPGLGIAVAKVIKHNKVLEDAVLELSKISDAVPICAALSSRATTTLKRLELMVHNPGSKACQETVTMLFSRMMSQNYTLNHLILRSPAGVMSNPELEFYLRLNRCTKRGNLLTNGESLDEIDPQQWVDTLIANIDDLSVLYYILLLNPVLCQHANKQSTNSIQNPRRITRANRKRKRCDNSSDSPILKLKNK